jgi:hypothetical protein
MNKNPSKELSLITDEYSSNILPEASIINSMFIYEHIYLHCYKS